MGSSPALSVSGAMNANIPARTAMTANPVTAQESGIEREPRFNSASLEVNWAWGNFLIAFY